MVKRLVSLISTKGKSPGQAAAEVWEAFQKYQRVARQTIQQLLAEGKITQEQANWELSQLQAEPHEQVNSSVTTPQETPLERFTKTLSKAGVKFEVKSQKGLVTQITGYPRPPQNSQGAPAQPMKPQTKEESEVFFVNRKPEQLSQVSQSQPQQECEIVFLDLKPKGSSPTENPQVVQPPQVLSVEPQTKEESEIFFVNRKPEQPSLIPQTTKKQTSIIKPEKPKKLKK